ncbi:hypothetical protein [Methylorubrum extorquens]|uniref:Uncharacterized protein n=1 Tax=Methylorubrum extorquens (strain ATCC 14718 / DSM 1338 / JCM 2805 / NCIMB 9133 / AM1) TaxID=272630 RepID=C5B1D1_METEA|nr:hypothetical protein [Methylorubrum extorquens]ACS41732.1 hypothetical protein MexAM1_META1p4077 [Methylorubrum extorquens AM1]MCP1545242.1 hypothetical protein [Methylorubrum extorquens]MCP1587411.1 hypothetical protein [Methylorubrum extorquens]
MQRQNEREFSPIAWALAELDEIGHLVTGAPGAAGLSWRIDMGPALTARQVISFAIEVTAHGSSRLPAKQSALLENQT